MLLPEFDECLQIVPATSANYRQQPKARFKIRSSSKSALAVWPQPRIKTIHPDSPFLSSNLVHDKRSVGVEKVLHKENGHKFGGSKCPTESRKSPVGHSGAMEFLSVSRGCIFQQPQVLYHSLPGFASCNRFAVNCQRLRLSAQLVCRSEMRPMGFLEPY